MMKFAFVLIWALNTNQQITVPGIVDFDECQRLGVEMSKVIPDQKITSFICVPYQMAK